MFDKLRRLFRTELNLPPRTTASLEESIRSQKQNFAMKGAGAVEIYHSWQAELEHRPFDIPMYVAADETAKILIYVSSQSIPRSSDLKKVFDKGLPWTWNGSAFLDGPYPVLRCTLSVPDNPSNPLLLESPLNIRQGDVQAFCAAVLRNEHIDIVAAHESTGSDAVWGASYRCTGLGAVLLREVNRASAKLRPTATDTDFYKSVRMMEAKFPQPSSGLDSGSGVPLVYVGELPGE